jgi:hypothetical protein
MVKDVVCATQCRLCRDPLDLSVAIHGANEGYFHSDCLRLILELASKPPTCFRCGAEVGVSMGINEIVVNPCVRCDSPKPLRNLTCRWCGNPVYEFQTFRDRMHWCCHARRTRTSVAAMYLFAILGGSLLVGGCWSIIRGSLLPFAILFIIGLPVALLVAFTVTIVRAVRAWMSDRDAFRA